MDLSKPGPLYEALRDKIGVSDAMRTIVTRIGDLRSDLDTLSSNMAGLERRTSHKAHDARLEGHDNDLKALAERLKAAEERLEKLPKPRPSRAKPKPLTAQKGAKGS